MPYRLPFVLACIVFSINSLFAQYVQTIKIDTKENMLLLGVDKDGHLKQVYYGKQINTDFLKDLTASGNDAYTSYGRYAENVALRLTHNDGNTTTNLVYKSHAISQSGANTTLTKIILSDSYYATNVVLNYKAYLDENIIEQWTEIINKEKAPVTLFDFASADLSFQSQSYYLSYYYGDWAKEFNMIEEPLHEGTKIIDSKLGVRSNQHSNPSFLLSLNQQLAEETGEAIGGTLAWPGSWQLKFDVDQDKKLHVVSGINPYASQYTIATNDTFKTASFLHTYTMNGAGEITRRFHRWARKYGITDGYGSRDVLLNNWEATYFNFDEQKLTDIIKEAGNMGFDLFLLDDGWFGNKYPRNNDDAGLGDWEVNKKKLPHGISYLTEQCQKNNLKFGIWIEPEMVNPKSELYEKHPDWAISAPNRVIDPQRNQLILDLANPKVEAYVYGCIDNLLRENKGISYIKWDCNRYVTNPGSAYLGKDKQSHLFIDYSRAIIRIMEKVRKNFPSVTMMVCSGGGGRMDYATMPYFQEYWPSDNTDALDRIKIQWGLLHFFPAVGLASHVSVTPNHITGRTTPLKFRFDVAMTGKLGMDLQPMQMTEDEKIFSKKAIQTYKNSIRDVVLHGDLYRLLSPYTSDRTAQMYVTEKQDKAIVFSYLLHKSIYGDKSVLYLKGLKKDAMYKIAELNKGSFSRLNDYEGKSFSGDFLMTHGLAFNMYNEFESAVIELTQQ
ncbi:alpha-galactosidase [Danxiaibacter flavus]|uniref:Alpha-galactosidase n=1 Tax=Danxiaibacter flavus TaxID=3049108 RepID=A0ABV3ZMN1_9BACT|nr:alpha-galactosidase [Chitinophagaceae bacterium DXS]